MALSIGAVGKDEEMGSACLKKGKGSLAPLVPFFRHNMGNRLNGEKSKSV